MGVLFEMMLSIAAGAVVILLFAIHGTLCQLVTLLRVQEERRGGTYSED